MYGWAAERGIRMNRKTRLRSDMRTGIAILFCIVLSAFGQGNARAYNSDFSVVLDQGGALYDALPQKYGNQLASHPVTLQPQDFPQITPICSAADSKVMKQVSISAGFVSLINHLAHAKAIDHVQPGFFDQYVQNLARLTATDASVPPPDIVDANFWKDDIMNDQSSYFNQMVGYMIAINLSHHYLGHFDKYAAQMTGPGNKLVPINDLLSPAEWEASVRAAAVDSLTCALATDGASTLFQAIDEMPQRPSWTDSILPKTVNVKKLNEKLADYQAAFRRDDLKFGLLDKLQFGPGWNKPLIMRPAKKALDGGPAFLAVVERPMIDIHADELVGQFAPHVPGVLQGVCHGFRPVVQAEPNAVGQNVGNN